MEVGCRNPEMWRQESFAPRKNLCCVQIRYLVICTVSFLRETVVISIAPNILLIFFHIVYEFSESHRSWWKSAVWLLDNYLDHWIFPLGRCWWNREALGTITQLLMDVAVYSAGSRAEYRSNPPKTGQDARNSIALSLVSEIYYHLCATRSFLQRDKSTNSLTSWLVF